MKPLAYVLLVVAVLAGACAIRGCEYHECHRVGHSALYCAFHTGD